MKKSPFAMPLAIAGILLLVSAIAFSNTFIEQLCGRPAHSLSWGPPLFRLLLGFHGLLLLISARLAAPGGRTSTPGKPISRTAWIVLGVLTVVATALRIPGLNSCMWLDEVLTMVDFARPPIGHILSSFPNQNQHMLFSLLAHASIRIFGESAWAIRLPAVLFGIASIWALFLLGRYLIGETQALFSCALMTVSYHHVWFSQNARGYMGLLLFSILATWLWLEAQDRGDWRIWLAYSFALFLGAAIHMTIVFVIASHALIQIIVFLRTRDRRPLLMAVAAWILCGTLTLQLIALALPEFLSSAIHEVSMPSEWTNPFWVVAEMVRSLKLGFASAIVLLGGFAMVLFGWLDLLRRNARAAWAMVLPAILGGGTMLYLSHNLWPRFFFFCMGFALLIVVHGAMSFPSWLAGLFTGNPRTRRIAQAAGVAFASLLILASATTVPRCYALPKQDYTGAQRYLAENGAADDSVVVVGLAGHVYGRYYAPQWYVAHTVQELETFRRSHTKPMLVYTLPIELKAFHADLWQAVEADFEPERTFPGSLGGGEVFVCRERIRTSGERSAIKLPAGS